MMIWIFVGVVVATTMFLMVMYKNNRDQLRTQFLSVNALNNEDFPLKEKLPKLDTQESLDAKLWSLALKLKEKEQLLRTSIVKISEVEQKLGAVDSQDFQERNNRKVLEELKLELELTELECKNLHEQIRIITLRREELNKEVNKQHDQFNAAMNSLVKDLRFARESSVVAGAAPEVPAGGGTTASGHPLEPGVYLGGGRAPSREVLDS